MDKHMIASGAIVNLEGLRRDMRANAFEYLARLNAGQSLTDIALLIFNNSTQYIRRVEQMYRAERVNEAKSSLLAEGLAVDSSVTPAMLDTFAAKLLAVAQTENRAIIKTAADISAVAAATLRALPFAP